LLVDSVESMMMHGFGNPKFENIFAYVLDIKPATCRKGVYCFLGVKWPGHGVDHSRPCSTGVLFPL